MAVFVRWLDFRSPSNACSGDTGLRKEVIPDTGRQKSVVIGNIFKIPAFCTRAVQQYAQVDRQ